MRQKKGKLFLVSVGPGCLDLIPPMAEKALRESEVIIGYELYLKWISPWIQDKVIITAPLTQEQFRAEKALESARNGKTVSLISSGDIGVYAMATLAFELMEENEPFEVEVIPGISAANASAALLGAPLSHDFATLSLSDLLCPWEMIVKRARALAQADFVIALYNVQSQERQTGIYEILKILLENKPSGTLCGIVRDAYREDVSIQVYTLHELLTKTFDMRTTLIIGNQSTRRKGRFIFTARGYFRVNGQLPKKQTLALENQLSVWVFSGTGDGNALAGEIRKHYPRVIISTASDYGLELAQRLHPEIEIRSGKIGIEKRREELKTTQAKLIVDATHPFATEISSQLIQLSTELNVPYIRYERKRVEIPSFATRCQNFQQAAKKAIQQGQRIFLATGINTLSHFLTTPGADKKDWFIRVTPDENSIRRALIAGIPREQICAMQGSFSRQFNEAQWREWKIDCVVTKESGEAGGFNEKIAATQKMNLPLIVVERPVMTYPNIANDDQTIIDFLSHHFLNKTPK